jgi:hypothetical protein
MSALREAAQQALEVLESLQGGCTDSNDGTVEAITVWCPEVIDALRAALAQEEQATGKERLQVDPKGGMQIATPLPLTTTDLAWLETRRLVRVWKELGQIRWTGADEGWDLAIEAVRARLDKECQDVLAWKEQADVSGQAAAQLLLEIRGGKDE